MARPELDRLTLEVTEITTVTDSAIALINGLAATVQQVKDELAATGVTNDTLNALSDSLNTQGDALAAAVAANTPAAPPE